ncbi:MAG: hypothetical protein ABJG15_04565 [Hyphomonadaceae bacterium]
MMHPSTMKLVDRLCAMTKQSKIEWSHGEEPDSLLYDTEGYRVILLGEPASIKLTDTAGNDLENVSAAELADTPHPEMGTYDMAVAGLVTDAQRIARGTETAISSVLEGLDLDGDGVVDIPMEDGLVPTPAEISDPQPDVVEDTADESGVATLADADVEDMSNAVASLADEVNQAETQSLTEMAERTATETGSDEPSHIAAATTGLTAAGLGAAGLVKAAGKTINPDESDQTRLPEAVDGQTHQTHTASIESPVQEFEASPLETAEDFSLSDATDSEPLQLSPVPVEIETPEAELESEPNPDVEVSTFVPPQPGEVLSLSGLTKNPTPDIPIMAGTATSMPFKGQNSFAAPPNSYQTADSVTPAAPAAPAPPEPEPEPIVERASSPEAAVISEPTPPEPEAAPNTPEPEAIPEAAAPTPEPPVETAIPEPEAEEVAAPENDAEAQESSSRFNPWI